jgi:iron(III) transport system ATP-binding protein
MLLDEPFSALDAGLREQMRATTAAILAGEGITTLLVTHDQAEAMEFADQIVVLRGGRLRQAGPPAEVYRAPADPETAEFLGEAIILDAVIEGGIAACSLGRVPVDRAREGLATIMLRPEQIALRPPEAAPVNGAAVAGRVLASSVAGPTARIMFRPSSTSEPDGSLVLRMWAHEAPAVGSLVSVTVTGFAHVFEACRVGEKPG